LRGAMSETFISTHVRRLDPTDPVGGRSRASPASASIAATRPRLGRELSKSRLTPAQASTSPDHGSRPAVVNVNGQSDEGNTHPGTFSRRLGLQGCFLDWVGGTVQRPVSGRHLGPGSTGSSHKRGGTCSSTSSASRVFLRFLTPGSIGRLPPCKLAKDTSPGPSCSRETGRSARCSLPSTRGSGRFLDPHADHLRHDLLQGFKPPSVHSCSRPEFTDSSLVSLLLQLCVEPPLRLPLTSDLLSQRHGVHHPFLERLHLPAWKLSSDML